MWHHNGELFRRVTPDQFVHDIAVVLRHSTQVRISTAVVGTYSHLSTSLRISGLQNLYDKYKEKGFVVLGFPCNQVNILHLCSHVLQCP